MINSRPVDGGDLWLGNEFLLSYHGDDAHKALADVRSLIGTCPPVASNGITTTYQLGQDSAYGDEGLDLRAVLEFSGGSQMERQSAAVRSAPS